ncbi:sigma-54-dependent Fis family transcriptional regulator [Acidisoma cellulosilytica]|uniref:Sigma-54-dependent Fis family transcriptional regulator n=1 Tax=Acidisoma cellulosilyticum TaxID=2802395 RepID=A0A964E6F9_9PROT|nr:sigma-54-dependent Fis family transcriptional regulator [Acidisoma cellulosilyticum]MCB8883544.1 sigma-54-dependent Fis family transcriptional regulator [Acidisoma cellulosilyticum]
MLISTEDRLIRARAVLERRHAIPTDLLAPDISASWSRCLDYGLDPEKPPPLTHVAVDALRHARDETGAMRPLVLAEMENLYHQIAGSNFMIAFARGDGLLLDTIADSSFGATAHATRIQPGCLWSEEDCGTNALGSVAATRRALTIHGGEHFFNRYDQLTCTAAPVFAPDGALAGVLDASSDCRSRQQHTRALVSMAATQIENGLFRDKYRDAIVMAFHNRAEYLHTLSAGLMAFDPSGTILSVTPRARLFLQGLPASAGRRFDEVFRLPFGAFIDAGRLTPQSRLQDRVGSVFLAHLEHLSPQPKTLSHKAAPATKPGFIAADPAVITAMHQVEAAAIRGLPILISGETGTGKEQLARHAHAASGRRGAFVPVNCAALPETLVEAELFGHAEGAFTGARRGGAAGLVTQAHGGTLFLDEIGDMPVGLQAVLLRLLDDWTVRPVGGHGGRQVDVLLVAATHVDLTEQVAQGRFRADLYYRLDTIEAHLPPLRSRTDFAEIARHILASLGRTTEIEPSALTRLARHAWPGNIRELRNLLTRLTLIDPPDQIDDALIAHALGPSTSAASNLRGQTAARIAAVHREVGGNLSATARRLGVSRNTIYRALRRGDG